MANLYELMDEYKALSDAAAEGDFDRVDALLLQLDETRGSLRDKVDNVCRVVRNMESNASQLKREAARLSVRKKSFENSATRLRAWVRSAMDAMGVDSIKTSLHTISLAKENHVLVVLDAAKLPEEFIEREIKVRKKKLNDAYKETGELFPGTDLVPAERVLTIR